MLKGPTMVGRRKLHWRRRTEAKCERFPKGRTKKWRGEGTEMGKQPRRQSEDRGRAPEHGVHVMGGARATNAEKHMCRSLVMRLSAI